MSTTTDAAGVASWEMVSSHGNDPAGDRLELTGCEQMIHFRHFGDRADQFPVTRKQERPHYRS